MKHILTQPSRLSCKNPARIFEVTAEQAQRNVLEVTGA
jgi:hypothetical protein